MSAATMKGLDAQDLRAEANRLLADGTPPEHLVALLEERAANPADVSEAVAAALLRVVAKLHPASIIAAKQQQATDDGYRVVLTPYAEIEAKGTTWLWTGRMPEAALTVNVGSEGLGKTALGVRFVRDLTRGELPGALLGTPVTCALLTPEDDPSRTIKPRLMAAGADMARVLDLTMRKDAKARGLSLPGDTDRILEALVDHDVRFVLADPIVSMLDPRVNTWKDSDVREALEQFVEGAAREGITTLGNLHTNKANSSDPRQRGMGTAAWRQIPRAWLVTGLDPEDEKGKDGTSRCVALDKHNYGRPQPTIRFALESRPVEVEGRQQDVVCAVLGEECDVTASEMLAAEQELKTTETKGDAAMKWLRRFLSEGPKAVKAIEDSAETAGHAWRTVERAAGKEGLAVVKKNHGPGRGWLWSLPEDDGLAF